MTTHLKGGGDNLGVKSVKPMYFLKNLLYSGAGSIQTKSIVIMIKEGEGGNIEIHAVQRDSNTSLFTGSFHYFSTL